MTATQREGHYIPGDLAVDELRVDVLEGVADRAERFVRQPLVGALVQHDRKVASIERVRQREQERRDDRVEHAPVRPVHLIRAAHFAARRLQYAPARVLEVLARTKVRLMPDHPWTSDLFDLSRGVGDDPMPRAKLSRL